MRGPTAYETYLYRMRDYYKIKKIKMPEWIEKAIYYCSRYYNPRRYYSEMCTNNAIPKVAMEYLADLEVESLDDIPQELAERIADIHSALKDMYNELMSGKELYFINEWTLSRGGRKK